jgi:nucleoside-diphosphate-sugar epimerase
VKALVTGAAGFVGSTLVDALLADGVEVRGVDCFTDYYDPVAKRANLAEAVANSSFELLEEDLRTAHVEALLDEVEVVFHQAAQPGVRLSWDAGFATYDSCNVLATQRLLEGSRRVGLRRFVYASSSSVYGNAGSYPVGEGALPRPHSPYGVTKLAAEHLCTLYAANYGLSTVSLRYFTVYGPRQRPDMAIHRLIESVLHGTPFPLYGDGSHIRDFTFVGDIVAANRAAAEADIEPGLVMNVCGGASTSMRELIQLVGAAAGADVVVERLPEQPGDVQQTGGDGSLARRLIGWDSATTLPDGVAAQVAWHVTRQRDGKSIQSS